MVNTYLILTVVLLLLAGGMAGYVILTGINNSNPQNTLPVAPARESVTPTTNTTNATQVATKPTATPVATVTPTATATALPTTAPGYFDQGTRYGINAVPPGPVATATPAASPTPFPTTTQDRPTDQGNGTIIVGPVNMNG